MLLIYCAFIIQNIIYNAGMIRTWQYRQGWTIQGNS